MALKSLLFFSLLVAVAAAPVAEAQLGNIIGSILDLIRIQGICFAQPTATWVLMAPQPQLSPVNAPVQLQCGAGNVISSATTNSAGLFSILLDPLQFLLSSLLTNCNLVVNTPLSTCNSGLPSSGALLSPLRLIGNTLQGPLHITNIIPANFVFLPHL
ncbi:Phylloplanin [Vitis vinifera]|uniref:Phylloplanin n=1 Tax=Vitis vinifera TaxID=29760 RepID=A0A438IQS0_VITVI|nr:Phylloplanin [Vitis vinifera]